MLIVQTFDGIAISQLCLYAECYRVAIIIRGAEEEKEYLVKWKDLSYDECYWELESDIASFQKEIEKFKTIQSHCDKISKVKQKISARDATDSKKKLKEFQHYESNPGFLSGGTCTLQKF